MTDRQKNQILFGLLGLVLIITSGFLGHMAYNLYFNPSWNSPTIQRDWKYFVNNSIYPVGFIFCILGGLASFAAALSEKWEGRFLEKNPKPDAFICLTCKYDLRGIKLVSGASCPECGCTIKDEQIEAIAQKIKRKRKISLEQS